MADYQARYTGRNARHTRRGPSGEQYTFPARRGDPQWVDIDEDDAEYFRENVRYLEVRKKGAAQKATEAAEGVVARLRAHADSLGSYLGEMAYEDKHEAADELGVDVPGNASHDELDEEIQAALDQLQEEGEI